ncbi:MAG TPA: dihydropteroate synthase [Verrucomicrobia bacterium]|nr:dihydropteroate synthase [Verrucomicrobiota bacterium]
MHWQCCHHRLNIGTEPLIMGILNTTPDSFSDGGRFVSVDAALARGREMLAAGANIIDIGGESTRPGADPVDVETECLRVLPIIEALAAETGAVISVDTMKARVAREALRCGAVIVNDVSGMVADPDMTGVVRETGAGVILMHMPGTPQTMQAHAHYGSVVDDVALWLASRLSDTLASGIAAEAIAIDPGIGFGKTTDHNLSLIAQLDWLGELGCPILVGVSRKRFIGELSGVTVADQRLAGSLAALTCAVLHGAHILRVHDVSESRQAALVAAALRRSGRVGKGSRV